MLDNHLPSGGPNRKGLDSQSARLLLQTHGPNALAREAAKSLWSSAGDVVREPMFLLLMACLTLYWVLGEWRESAALMVSVVAVMGITLVQARRTTRAMDALKDMASPRALVIRDGERRRISAQDLVPGDLMVLLEGDRVPADGVLLEVNNLHTDESLLTGESLPVPKRAASHEGRRLMARPGETPELVYAGSLVVQGQGYAEVLATGERTEIGRIGEALNLIQLVRTPLQDAAHRLVRRVAMAVLVLGLGFALVLGLSRGNWSEAILAGIAWTMALIPEEFPVVLTIFLALGAWRMSQRNVLTRRMPALEALGAATVLCVDKTGTLTENRMQVARLVPIHAPASEWSEGAGPAMNQACRELLGSAILSSRREPFDPMEVAIHALGKSSGLGQVCTAQGHEMVREYPLSPDLMAVSRAWRTESDQALLLATKGAPEAVLALCRWPADQAQAVLNQARDLARQGMRVLAVARGIHMNGAALPDSPHGFEFELLGLLALTDPIRAEVPMAIEQCHQAGIRLLMITGDLPETALSIARQSGLVRATRDMTCMTGAEVLKLDDAGLRAALPHCHVIARATPDLKLRVIQALQANGDVVAMTGDGVNDAPALKAADIGIAMGGRGTDVAREAADIILTDDRFSSIVEAVRLGRRIYANLTKACGYIVAIHIPIAGLSLLPVLSGGTLMLLPIHIAFLELMIDPACSVAFEAEPEAADAMRKPPRNRLAGLFGMAGIWPWVAQGLALLAAVALVHEWARREFADPDVVRTLSFGMLVLSNLSLLISRGWKLRNPTMWAMMMVTAAFLGLILSLSWMRSIFHLGVFPGWQAGTACLLLALLLVPCLAAVRPASDSQPRS